MYGLAVLVAGFFALLLLVGGVALIAADVSGGLIGGGIMVLMGVGILGALAFERRRYRSDPSEQVVVGPRSPGGEDRDERLDPRFRPTDEVFVDPSSRRRMRVYVDAATGERRYRVEG